MSEERGVRTLSHGGARVGFGSLIVMALEKRVAVIVVTNRSGSTLGAVAQKALESLVEFQPETPAATTTVELSATDLARYTGTYAGGTTRVVIGVEKGRLTVAFEGKTYEAKALGGHRFSSEGPWNEFVFVTGADGRIRYVHADLRTLRRTE